MTYFKKIFVAVLIFSALGLSSPPQAQATELDAYNNMDNEVDAPVEIDLAADTNNRGYLPLDDWISIHNDDEENAVDKPGCILFINDNDDDGNKIPDFAQLSANSGETNLAPLKVTLYISDKLQQTDLGRIKIAFVYEGETSPGTASGNELSGKVLLDNSDYSSYPFSNTSSKQLYNYSPIRTNKKPLRIWKSLPTSTRNPNDATTGGDYIVPGADKYYTTSQLGFDPSSGINKMEITLYVEGVNEAKTGETVKVVVYFDDEEIYDDIVKFTVLSGGLLVNSSNDSKFTLDSKDDLMEDQEDGFLFWTVSSTRDNTNSYNLENAFPVKTFFPEIAEDAFFTPTVIVKNMSTGEEISFFHSLIDVNENVLNHLIDSTVGEATSLGSTPNDHYALFVDGKLTDGIVERSSIVGLQNEGTYLIKLVARKSALSLDGVTVDTALITIKSIDKFTMFGSLRGTPTTSYTYNTDDSRYEDILCYPDITWNTDFASRQAYFDKFLVMVHGFNVNLEAAKTWARVMFRRSYWQGFRGNFIGVAWHGDEIAPVFDPNVYNAFQTSPTFMNFIVNKLHGTYNASADDISVMAHSLGNFVTWDALRLYRRTHTTNLIKDVLSIEAAVWIDTFLPQANYEYVAPSDPIEYDVDELKKHSWAFWFNQEVAGNSRAANESLSGNYYHSYNAQDSDLAWMQRNDYLFHSTNLPYVWVHYSRRNAFSDYREPDNQYSIPALLNNRTENYTRENLIPAGRVSNTAYTDVPVNAATGGWDATMHSDCKNKPLYKVSTWYEQTVWKMLNDWGMKR